MGRYLPSALGRLSSSAARLLPSGGRLPSSPDRLPSSLALAFWCLRSSSPVAFWPRPFASLLPGPGRKSTRILPRTPRVLASPVPIPTTEPSSFLESSSPSFLGHRGFSCFSARRSPPLLLRVRPIGGVHQRHRSAPLIGTHHTRLGARPMLSYCRTTMN